MSVPVAADAPAPSLKLSGAIDTATVGTSLSLTVIVAMTGARPLAVAVTSTLLGFSIRELSTAATEIVTDAKPAGIVTVVGKTSWSAGFAASVTTSGDALAVFRVIVRFALEPPSVTELADQLIAKLGVSTSVTVTGAELDAPDGLVAITLTS